MTIAIAVQTQGDHDILEYSGPINAEAEVYLTQILSKISQKVKIDLSGVSSVNSCGVRSWINFMRELEAKGHEITFEKCAAEVVMQFNMIPSFKGPAKVNSLFGNYVCDNCGAEREILFESGKNLPASPDDELEEVICASCSHVMELDELEEEFFAFLKTA